MISEIDGIDFLVQRAVDPIFHLHFGVARFDVNVGSARFHGVIDNRVDQLDDWRHLTVGCQPIEVEYFFARLGFAHQRDPKSRRRLLQNSLRGVALAQHNIDGAGRRHVRNQPSAQRIGKIVQAIEIGRIGHRDVQLPVLAPQRHELIADHQLDRNLAQQRIVDRRLSLLRQQIDVRQTIAARQFPGAANFRRVGGLRQGREIIRGRASFERVAIGWFFSKLLHAVAQVGNLRLSIVLDSQVIDSRCK